MELCLYHHESDYLAALERGCLSSGCTEFRLRLFSEVEPWMEAIQTKDFRGIALAPENVMDSLPEYDQSRMLTLTDAREPGKSAVSIYSSMDDFFNSVRSAAQWSGNNHSKTGTHLVFSFSSWQQESQWFDALQETLRREVPTAALMDLATLRKRGSPSGGPMSEWLWDKRIPEIREGESYCLYENPADSEVSSMEEWRDLFSGAIHRCQMPLWIWCGSEWNDTVKEASRHAVSSVWICETPKEMATASKWSSMLKKRKNNISSFLISKREGDSVFDGHFETLSAYLSHWIRGGAL
jgi:hypothetical protein